MCGIAGFFDGNADFTANREKYENILQKMQQSILHRGPDEQGIYLGKRAGLAHTRLSIIEPQRWLPAYEQTQRKEFLSDCL